MPKLQSGGDPSVAPGDLVQELPDRPDEFRRAVPAPDLILDGTTVDPGPERVRGSWTRAARSAAVVSRSIWRHLVGLLASLLAVSATCVCVLGFIFLCIALGDRDWDLSTILVLPFTLLLIGFWAAVIALPYVIVGYPLALYVAERVRRSMLTALIGAAAGPIVGFCASLVFSRIQTTLPLVPVYPQNGIEGDLVLSMLCACCGGALGWTVSILRLRRSEQERPNSRQAPSGRR